MPNVLVGRVAPKASMRRTMANLSTNENEPLEGVVCNILFGRVALLKPVVRIAEPGEAAREFWRPAAENWWFLC